MKVKICGITCEKEIEYLNILKPDYMGFVFTKSKRQINAESAENLRQKLSPEVKCVGVFRDNSLKEINDILKKVKLDVVQLHGNENFDFINELRKNKSRDIEIWKALSIKNKTFMNQYISYYLKMKGKPLIDNILIDGSNPGSGETYSLAPFKDLLEKEIDSGEHKRSNIRFILAGGITSENVLQKIDEADPWGIDISSGVEENHQVFGRIKSFDKMKEIMIKVRERSC